MSAQWLLAWWNLIYVIPFSLALVYLGVYTVSGLTFGDADVDADADIDVDADGDLDGDVDHDADIETDVDGDVDADADADADADGDADDGDESSLYLDALSWLGVGRAPLSLLLMVLFLTWGGFGFIANMVFSPVMPWDWLSVAASMPLAALGSSYATRTVARLMGRYLPTTETYSRRRCELVGTSGQAMYVITAKFGLASVRDKHGDLFQAPCRVYEDCEPIPKGARLLLVDFDRKSNFFYAIRHDVEVDA